MKATGGRFLQGDPEGAFCGISTDTRSLGEGELYIALRGKRFDGHDFSEEAVRRGASGVLISKEGLSLPKRGRVVRVADTLEALGAIAAYHRRKFSIPVVAVTGSNGKTTTKEMIAHILSGRGAVLKNEGTKNNRIGVPLTLLGLEEDDRFAVLELGMSEKGEIGALSRMARPTVGVITNIGAAHLAFLKDLETVYACKVEILEGLERGGTLVLNGMDPYLKKTVSPAHALVFFGTGTSFSASDIQERGEAISFRLNDRLEGSLPLIGEHQVQNALAAIAATHLLGVEPSFALKQLGHFKGLNGRMTLRRIQGIDFIDDTYNANPESSARALESLRKRATKGRRIFVLGDMLELGEGSRHYHAAFAEKVASSKIDFFVTVGEFSRAAHDRASSLGMNSHRTAHFLTTAEAAEFLARTVRDGDCVLVKGSRGMRMEEVLKSFEGIYV